VVNLDDITVHDKYDTAGMRGQLHGFPRQCLMAWQQASAFSLPPDYGEIDKILILGMGGSAIGGGLLRSFAADLSRPLIFVNREYSLPPFVDEKTLVITSSYSGNTEETLTAFKQALQRNCKKLAMTTGGSLQKMAEAAGVPVFRIEHVSPPRAALGYGLLPLIAFLCQLGFLPDMEQLVRNSAAIIDKKLQSWGEDVLEEKNLAKALARQLRGRIVVIYGAGILSEVAHRWATQLNENSKAWAFHQSFPELNHNALVGYEFPAELARHISVVLLRSPNLHPRILMRYGITMEILQSRGISYHVAEDSAEDSLSCMLSMVFLGDWVSYYLAILYEIDPTPVRVIEGLKQKLGNIQNDLF
jgi:glucose/mannose-6-phosphate isomerase